MRLKGDEPVQTQRQFRYLYIPQRLVAWWSRPSVRAWMARMTARVERALEKAAQSG